MIYQLISKKDLQKIVKTQVDNAKFLKVDKIGTKVGAIKVDGKNYDLVIKVTECSY